MKRLTTDDPNSILLGINLFFVKDSEVWIRGGGPEPDYPDCTLTDWINRAAVVQGIELGADDAESLGDVMYDCLQCGVDATEGILALLHAAAVQAAEMRGRLALIEDILGDDYNIDRLRELAKADQDGRCVVLPVKVGDTVYRVITTRDCPPLLSEIAIKTVEQAASLIGRMGKHLVISYYPTREAAEVALKGDRDGVH